MDISNFIKIKENDKAIIWKIPSGEYEIWMKLYHVGGYEQKAPNQKIVSLKGKIREPKDEDFGCTCWQSYTLEKANRIFDEITSGERTIRVMSEEA